MSANLHVKLEGCGKFAEASLWQTPTDVTLQILAISRWQDQVLKYLEWVYQERKNDLSSHNYIVKEDAIKSIKCQRKEIGKLWQLADNFGGRLVFYKA